jgi:hypothetical protein
MGWEITVHLGQDDLVRTPYPEVPIVQADTLHRPFSEPCLFRLPKVVEGKLQRRRAAGET